MTRGDQVRERHIALIGLSGTGKSTLAPRLAVRLGIAAVDIDGQIVERCGASIAEIFRERGETEFRDLESSLLAEALDGPAAVVATGGGIVLRDDNRRRLGADAQVVWLNATPEQLADRLAIGGEERPLLGDQALVALRRLSSEREDLYRGLADVEVDTDGVTPDDVVEHIISALAALTSPMSTSPTTTRGAPRA
ncbi:MAG: shikimate kinase [Acidimicrobiales bacterium]